MIESFGFHDVPRQIVVEHEGQLDFLDCIFVEDRDDYADSYVVWRLDRKSYQRVRSENGTVDQMLESAVRSGEVPVNAVREPVSHLPAAVSNASRRG